MPPETAGPAPELAAPELAAAMKETREYRELLAEVLRQFEDPVKSGWWHARVRESTLRRWMDRAGIKERA